MFKLITLHKKTILSTLILFSLWLLFFYRIFFYGENLYCCDNNLINIPANVFLSTQLKLGHFPLWNPYLFSGTPFVSDINLSPFYPMNLLYVFFTPFRALTLGVTFNVLIGLIGMYWCARMLQLSRGAALFSATVFGFSGTMVVYTGNAPMSQVVSLLPWAFGSWVLYIRETTKKHLVIVSLVTALQVIAGHPQLTFFTALLCGLYALVFLPGSFVTKCKILLPIGLLTFLLSSIQLIPFLELASGSTRIAQGLSYSTAGSLPITSFVRIFLPSIVGDLRNGTDWWQGGTVFGYVGVLSFLFVIAALRKTRQVLFFAVVAAITWLAAFGDKTPVYYLFYYLVPGISLFRVPSHFLLISTFCVAVLVGIGIDSLSTRRFNRIRLDQLSMMLIILGGGLLLIYRVIGAEMLSFLLTVPRLGDKLKHFTPNSFSSFLYTVSFNLLFIGLTLRTFSLVLRREFKHRMKIVLLLLLFSDLFLYSRFNLLTVKSNQTDQWQEQSQQIMTRLTPLIGESYRLYVDPSLYPSHFTALQGKAAYQSETSWQLKTLRPNIAMQYSVPVVDGYASIISRTYQQYFGVPSLDPTGINIGSMENPKLDHTAAGLILIPRNKTYDTIKFSKVMENDQFLAVKNLTARPIISLETGTGIPSAVPFVQPHPGELIALSESSQAATLVVAQQNYPGWKAFIDGKTTLITPHDGILQSVQLSPGNHTIRFLYLPDSFVVGAVLSLFGITISAALWLWPRSHS